MPSHCNEAVRQQVKRALAEPSHCDEVMRRQEMYELRVEMKLIQKERAAAAAAAEAEAAAEAAAAEEEEQQGQQQQQSKGKSKGKSKGMEHEPGHPWSCQREGAAQAYEEGQR